MENIYNAIQNVYNMDKTTWQEVLAELYNLISKVENKFDLFENKFGVLLGEEVTIELKKMYDDGSLASLINDKLLKDINSKVDSVANNTFINVKDFGANGNGVKQTIGEKFPNKTLDDIKLKYPTATDLKQQVDDLAFKESIRYAILNNVKKIYIPKGVYYSAITTELPSNIEITGDGKDLTKIVSLAFKQGTKEIERYSSVFSIYGTCDDDISYPAQGTFLTCSPRPFLENSTFKKGSKYISYKNTTDINNLAKGDYIIIREGAIDPHPCKSEFAEITSIDLNEKRIYLNKSIENSYSNTNTSLGYFWNYIAKGRGGNDHTNDIYGDGRNGSVPNVTTWECAGFNKINLTENIKISNLTIDASLESFSGYSIITRLCRNIKLDNVKILGELSLLLYENLECTECDFIGDKVTNGKGRYAFLGNGSSHGNFEKCNFYGIQIMIEEGIRDITINNCLFNQDTRNIYLNGNRISFENNTIFSNDSGLNIRATINSSINNNVIESQGTPIIIDKNFMESNGKDETWLNSNCKEQLEIEKKKGTIIENNRLTPLLSATGGIKQKNPYEIIINNNYIFSSATIIKEDEKCIYYGINKNSNGTITE